MSGHPPQPGDYVWSPTLGYCYVSSVSVSINRYMVYPLVYGLEPGHKRPRLVSGDKIEWKNPNNVPEIIAAEVTKALLLGWIK